MTRNGRPARAVLAVGCAVALVAAAGMTTAAAVSGAAPSAASQPGTPSSPYPTVESLTILWPYNGDRNNDATVRVRYRAAGASAWRTGMPLRRAAAGSVAGHTWGERLSGSLLDLQPATSYEIELRLTDPDGGSVTRILRARTRAVPVIDPAAPVRRATPSTLAAVMTSARPGDIVQLGAGTYAGFTWTASGTPAKPVVVRATPGAVIDGDVGMFYRHDIHLDGLTVNGRIRFPGSDDIAITHSTVRARADVGGGDGITADLRARNAYLVDNTVIGTTKWREPSLGADGDNLGEGIMVTGPGTVISHNRVSHFRDDISTLEGEEAAQQFSIDILDNDVSFAGDDAIEADYCFHNCRILRNRITDSFMGISAQPSLGGPTYVVRNVMYDVIDSAFKLHNGSTGDVVVNNTVVKNGDALGIYAGVPIRSALFRNNLLIGGPGGTYNGWDNGTGEPIAIGEMTGSSLDYDAFGTTSAFVGRLDGVRFASLSELRARTSEKHAVRVSLSSVFAHAVAYPAAPLTAYRAPDLRLAATGGAVDVGVAIPGLTDGFTGRAPDAGAYELGAPRPAYGPRPA